MPRCPDCKKPFADFDQGEFDPYGVWFCAPCWDKFEHIEKEERLKSGKLLPEDRVLWYSNSVKPTKLFEADRDVHDFLGNHANQREDASWLEVDNYSLVLEFYAETDDRATRRSDEQNSQPLGSTSYVKSLPWRHAVHDDVFFSLDGGYISIGESLPTCSLSDLPEIWSMQLIVSDRAQLNREKARLLRKARSQESALALKHHEEKEEQRRKQQVQVEAKKKELLELAVKRAQQKKTFKKPSVDRLTLLKKKVETWKSQVVSEVRLAVANEIRRIGESPPWPENPKKRKIESPPPSSAKLAARSVAEEARRIARLGMPLRPPSGGELRKPYSRR